VKVLVVPLNVHDTILFFASQVIVRLYRHPYFSHPAAATQSTDQHDEVPHCNREDESPDGLEDIDPGESPTHRWRWKMPPGV
jgi:hypothetical protein